MEKNTEETKKPENGNLIMERMLKSRRILLSEPVDMKTAQKIIEYLFVLEQDDPEKPIYLFINSPGGEVNSGLAIYDVMQFIKPKIYTIGCGLVASIAAIIFLQPEKKYRISLPSTEFLLHQPSVGGIQGSASDLEIHANQILKMRTFLNRIISDKTAQGMESVEKHTRRDFWMNAKEACDYGMVSKIISCYTELDDSK